RAAGRAERRPHRVPLAHAPAGEHRRHAAPPGRGDGSRGQRPRRAAGHAREDLLPDGDDARRRQRPGPADRAIPDPQPRRPDGMPLAAGQHRVLDVPAAGERMSAATDLTAWVVDDDESIRWVLEKSLSRAGVTVRSFVGSAELLDAMEQETPDVLISDIRM